MATGPGGKIHVVKIESGHDRAEARKKTLMSPSQPSKLPTSTKEKVSKHLAYPKKTKSIKSYITTEDC